MFLIFLMILKGQYCVIICVGISWTAYICVYIWTPSNQLLCTLLPFLCLCYPSCFSLMLLRCVKSTSSVSGLSTYVWQSHLLLHSKCPTLLQIRLHLSASSLGKHMGFASEISCDFFFFLILHIKTMGRLPSASFISTPPLSMGTIVVNFQHFMG